MYVFSQPSSHHKVIISCHLIGHLFGSVALLLHHKTFKHIVMVFI